MGDQPNGVIKWTPTERRMVTLLADGQPHTIHELQECLNNDLGTPNNVRPFLASIRFKLRPFRKGVMADVQGSAVYYRLVQYCIESPI